MIYSLKVYKKPFSHLLSSSSSLLDIFEDTHLGLTSLPYYSTTIRNTNTQKLSNFNNIFLKSQQNHPKHLELDIKWFFFLLQILSYVIAIENNKLFL